MISSFSVTCTAPTTGPFRSLVFKPITPWVALPFTGNWEVSVLLPKPFSLTVRTCLSSSGMISEIISAPACNRMPRTPLAWRPMTLTADSLNRKVFPLLLTSIMSCSPSVIAVPIRVSSSRSSIARRPTLRGRSNSVRTVFLTVPLRVAMKTKWSSSNSLTASIAVMRSPSSRVGMMLMMGLPREVRDAGGIW